MNEKEKLEELRASLIGKLSEVSVDAIEDPIQRFNMMMIKLRTTNQASDLEDAAKTAELIEDPEVKTDAYLQLIEEIDFQLSGDDETTLPEEALEPTPPADSIEVAGDVQSPFEETSQPQ